MTPRVGQPVEIKVARNILAERLCRLTGEGRFRDSLLLGHAVPAELTEWNGRVAGQDSIQAVVHRGQVHCFWGDTLRIDYPWAFSGQRGRCCPYRTRSIHVPTLRGDFPIATSSTPKPASHAT